MAMFLPITFGRTIPPGILPFRRIVLIVQLTKTRMDGSGTSTGNEVSTMSRDSNLNTVLVDTILPAFQVITPIFAYVTHIRVTAIPAWARVRLQKWSHHSFHLLS
jgi:hypothetical protein